VAFFLANFVHDMVTHICVSLNDHKIMFPPKHGDHFLPPLIKKTAAEIIYDL